MPRLKEQTEASEPTPSILYHVLVRRYTACAALTALVIGIVGVGCSIGDDVEADLKAAKRFNAYPLYWVGERFEKWPLVHVEVENSPFATLIYGNCEASGDSGCAPPLQIQISPLCDHLDLVTSNPIWKRRHVRGAPVGSFDGAPVLFTRRAQVKVYRGVGSDPGVELRALHALRSLNQLSPRFGSLGRIPGPLPGVLEGTRGCPG